MRLSNSKPQVSIIVLTYNSSKYILETLESCRNQTYDAIELIVSDDASNDDTLLLCEKWIEKNSDAFNKITIVRSDHNTGVAGNLNRGVLASTSEWFKLIAGDDLLTSNCIRYNMDVVRSIGEKCRIYNTMKKHFRDVEGQKIFVPVKGRLARRAMFFDTNNSADDQLKLAVRSIRPSINGNFIQRSLFMEVGMCDERFQMIEDLPLLIRILGNGHRIFGDNSYTVLYRVHEGSVFNSGTSMIYPSWHFEYFIPMFRAHFFPYLSWHEQISYRYSFIVAHIYSGTILNNRNLFTRILNKILLLPHSIFFKYSQNKVIKGLQRQGTYQACPRS